MKYALAALMILAATPAEARVEKGTMFILVEAGACSRKDVLEEILATGDRQAATQKLHDYYRMALNGNPICWRIESQKLLVLDVIKTAVMDGVTFQFIEAVTPEGQRLYSLITDLVGQQDA